jgi:hypothetical protein
LESLFTVKPMQKYQRVLDLMKQKGGKIAVTDPDLKALLGRLIYRLPTYISYIRRFANLEVTGIRNADPALGNGRKVVAYELAAVAVPVEAPVTVQSV